MANPFLMDDDLGDDTAVNPFFGGQEDELDNPFVGQATNPFAGFGDEPEDVENTGAPKSVSDLFQTEESDNDAAMSFFGTTIQEDDALSVELKNQQNIQHDETTATYSSEDEVGKKKGPPPRPTPPSQQTQQLIDAVSDQLDAASSHMLERIPVTRTPSPVSMRDLHSPSPTPDGLVADLLEISDQENAFNTDLIGEQIDNQFTPQVVQGVQPTPPQIPPGKVQPPRPPPPRPGAPPRPAPPPVAAVPVQVSPVHNISNQKAQNNDGDLFDVYGNTRPPKPPPPKTKEDILSLFTAPTKPQEQPDLLSDDLVLSNDAENVSSATQQVKVIQQVEEDLSTTSKVDSPTKQDPIFSSIVTEPDNVEKDIPIDEDEPVQIPMHSINPELPKRAPTPDIEITTVPDLPRSDDEEEEMPQKESEPEIHSEVIYEPEPELEPAVEPETEIIPPDHNAYTETNDYIEPEHMDTGLDFAPASDTGSANPFASPDDEVVTYPQVVEETNLYKPATNVFAEPTTQNQITANNIRNTVPPPVAPRPLITNIFQESTDRFDAFSAKFDSVKKDGVLIDGFGSITPTVEDAWGDGVDSFGEDASTGFGGEDGFDSFLAMKAPETTYSKRRDSGDSGDREFNVVIRPKDTDTSQTYTPVLAPPPPPRGSQNNSIYSGDSSPRVNPFDKGDELGDVDLPTQRMQRTDSQETPPTPLFDEDVSQPLLDFPRITYTGPGWEMQLRQPNKKKITGQRFWKKIFARLVYQNDIPVVQLLNQATDKTPFQELPLQPSYSVSEIAAQQFDQFGKIFTMKLQYIFYKERPGVRPGQVTKAGRITDKLSQFAAYAIQGDYQGVKEFGSDLKKLGLPVEHAPQVSQLFKIGSMSYEDLKQFSVCLEEALFKISAHRDRALNYKTEEVQLTAVDEIYVEQDAEGHIHKQIARVRLFFLGFLSGMPMIELGVNDLWRQGKEVVGRHDIIPVVTEEWIRLEGVEFHNVVHQDEYERTRTIKFQPPDACYIELMRFRVRPPKNRELPFQLKASWCVTGNRVELKADILVPGFASRKLGQIPCEDVSVRFPIPECWIYLFRVEKHFRYGSVKSAHRRTGKIKGIERILGAVETLQESLIEVTSGQAKYEHHHRAIVWRCSRLPKEGQGAYTTHQMVCRMALTSYDQIPETLAPYAFVEFTMPATQVSHTTVRSVSVQQSDSDDPPEKYVRYLARHEYRVGIETTHGETTNAYLAATRTTIKEEPAAQPITTPMAPSDSDSDSN